MKLLFGVALLTGVVVLAVIVGQRLSTDAMAVGVGVVFGVAASVPTALLVALATRPRRSEPAYRRDDYQPGPPPPQIYVVQGGAGAPEDGGRPQLAPPMAWPGQWPSGQVIEAGEDEGQRRWRIIE